ncbi:inner membrane protein YjcH [Escherichia coli]|uniref:Inner membrane protein YjcH n=1 Tax=Escherichia coli TaxID=562 RepID=A0A377A7Z3_ECOLX|nr:inner membrane protein YjcH [Escherichia coli]
MNGTIYQRIEDNAHFRELVEKRQRFATILSIIMLAVYIGFILLIAFAPGWLGHAAESEHQRHTRYSNWCWSDCDLLCSHRYLHLAGERRIRPS